MIRIEEAMSSQSPEQTLAEKVRALEVAGVTRRKDQARALEIPLSTFMRHLRGEDMTNRRTPLDKWIPWTLTREHSSDPTARNLRFLAQAAARSESRARIRRGSAVQWARRLVEAGQDVTYDRKEGFTFPKVAPDVRDDPNPLNRQWYLRWLLTHAERFITNLPQLDDLGK